MASIHVTKRKCGWPVAGGGYIYIPTSDLAGELDEIPEEDFLIQPAISVEGLHLPDIGMVILPSGNLDAQGNMIYDLWDHIGSGNYKTWQVWWEEVKEKGFHNLIMAGKKSTLPVHLLGLESRYFGWHDTAGVNADGATFPAMFVQLPIGKLASFLVYEDPTAHTHEQTLKNLEQLDMNLFRVEIVNLENDPDSLQNPDS